MKKTLFKTVELYDKLAFDAEVQSKLNEGWKLLNCAVTSSSDSYADIVCLLFFAFLTKEES